MSKPSEFERLIAQLFTHLGTDLFGDTLVESVRALAHFDGSCLIFFHDAHSPKVVCATLPRADEKLFWADYIRGAYLLDPFFQLCEKGDTGIYRLNRISPPGFRSTKYYRKYIEPAGILDEVDYIFQGHGGISGLLSFSRSEALGAFDDDEINALERVEQIITSSMNAHTKAQGNVFEADDVGYRPSLLRERLRQFGKSALTPREYEIVHLMLAGKPSKMLAGELGISAETERTHRKNIYSKMQINSHADLLAAAIDYLLMIEN